MLTLILVILLVMFLLGAFPAWPYSRGWGYAPFGTILAIGLVVLLVTAVF